MKKLLLKILVIFVLFYVAPQHAIAQSSSGGNTALFAQGGYDWLDGAIAGGIQAGHLKFSVGWFPTKMPGSGDPVSGYTWAATWEDGYWNESGYYLSIGMNSAGYRYEESWNGGSWDGDKVEPMWIAMLGYRYGSYSGIYLKAGCGYGWNENASAFTYGASIGWAFGL